MSSTFWPIKAIKQLLLIIIIIIGLYGSAYSQSVIESNGNIILKDSKGKQTTLTTSGPDSQPSISPDGSSVVFRRTPNKKRIETASGDIADSELWVIDLRTLQTEKIIEPNSLSNPKEVLAGFWTPQYSQDSKSIYFRSSAWTTSNAIHRIDMQTRKVKYITDGNSLEVIRKGKYKGYLKVNKHKYLEGGGSSDCDYILTPDGKEIKFINVCL